jgi:hypothetical protein
MFALFVLALNEVIGMSRQSTRKHGGRKRVKRAETGCVGQDPDLGLQSLARFPVDGTLLIGRADKAA